MASAVRVGLVVLWAAMAVYGAASLTGWWLGVPFWARWEFVVGRRKLYLIAIPPLDPVPISVAIVGGVVQLAGLALVAVGAWPRTGRDGPRCVAVACDAGLRTPLGPDRHGP